MKKRNWILILLIVVCLAAFLGYRAMDAMRTDTEAPEIKLDAVIPEVSVADPQTALLQGITAKDKRDGDVTDLLVVERVTLLDSKGTLMVSYAAFDHAGNVAKAQREAKYTDYESPKFTLSAPLLYRYGGSFDVLETVGAVDAVDGEIQHRVRATSLVTTSIAEIGTHNVQFQVSNSLGDTVSVVLPVEVYDPSQYDAELSLTTYLVYLPIGSVFAPETYLNIFTLRGVATDLRTGLPAEFTLETNGQVQMKTPGTYPVEFCVTYTIKHATDSDRDQKYTGYSKLIVVVEG